MEEIVATIREYQLAASLISSHTGSPYGISIKVHCTTPCTLYGQSCTALYTLQPMEDQSQSFQRVFLKNKSVFCAFFHGSVFCCGKVLFSAFFPSKCGFSFLIMLAKAEFCIFINQFLCFLGLVS